MTQTTAPIRHLTAENVATWYQQDDVEMVVGDALDPAGGAPVEPRRGGHAVAARPPPTPAAPARWTSTARLAANPWATPALHARSTT
jgi:hypothetical protein